MHRNYRYISILVLIPGLALLAACGPSAASTPTPDANQIITQAAQTVAAQLTLTAPQVTATPVPTNPPLPTETSSGPAPTAAKLPTQPPAATNTSAPTTNQPTTQDAASFVEDVTIPDGTGAAPGVEFVKTWRIKNTGKTSWTANYSLVPIDGDRMSSPDSIPMPTEIRPGETVDISVKLVAPTKPGSYQTFFRLRNASGQFFRLDGTGDLWVKIVVGGVTATPNMTETVGAPTATPTATAKP